MKPQEYAIYNRDELKCQHPEKQIRIADDNTGAFCQQCREWISVTAVATSARIAELETTNSKLRATLESISYKAKRATTGHDNDCTCATCDIELSIRAALEKLG